MFSKSPLAAYEEYVGNHSAGKSGPLTNDLHLATAAFVYASVYPISKDPRHETIIRRVQPSIAGVRGDQPGFTRVYAWRVYDPERVLQVGKINCPEAFAGPRYKVIPTVEKIAVVQALAVQYARTTAEIADLLNMPVVVIRSGFSHGVPWGRRSVEERRLACIAAENLIAGRNHD